MRIRWLTPLLVAVGIISGAPTSAMVKLSERGICHPPDSQYYERTRRFAPMPTLAACLERGRLPKTYRGGSAAMPPPTTEREQEYERERFGGWADEDDDCRNTRHEILARLSTVPVRWTPDGCAVARGRWNDPYGNRIVLDAGKLDVDHIVPLKWAWERGAASWSEERREDFANDPANLLAVDASANRAKGAQSPDQWLPENTAYRCQYVLRFIRVATAYRLLEARGDARSLEGVRQRVCGR